jgi:hypothetical protein
MLRTPMSAQITLGASSRRANSLNTPRSHIASVAAFFWSMYSVIVDDRATEDCSFDAQLIAPPARRKTYPVVDLESS